MRTAIKLICVPALFISSSWALSMVRLNASVDRLSLNLSNQKADWHENDKCAPAIPPFQSVESRYADPETGKLIGDKKGMISEVTAARHTLYALASYMAYSPEDMAPDILTESFPGVTKVDYVEIGLPDKLPGDLRLDVYKLPGKQATLLIAFRGTNDFKDWYSNSYWITGWLPFENAYVSARAAFKRIRTWAQEIYGEAVVSYVTTGHSLGGGLAQHVAAGFPCVSAVTFNSSPVTARFVYAVPFDGSRVIGIREKDDELTRFANLIFGVPRDSDIYRDQPLQLVSAKEKCEKKRNDCPEMQHSMLELSVSMARMVAECVKTEPKGCGYNIRHDEFSQDQYTSVSNFYCSTYGKWSQDIEICPPTMP